MCCNIDWEVYAYVESDIGKEEGVHVVRQGWRSLYIQKEIQVDIRLRQ